MNKYELAILIVAGPRVWNTNWAKSVARCNAWKVKHGCLAVDEWGDEIPGTGGKLRALLRWAKHARLPLGISQFG